MREAWRAWEREDGLDHIWYRADDAKREIPNTAEAGNFIVGKFDRWRPSIHMPRWASRITLEVTGVRVQRLIAITNGDCLAEGICIVPTLAPRDSFRIMWDRINAVRGYPWEMKPWVWVLTFRRLSDGTAGDTGHGSEICSG